MPGRKIASALSKFWPISCIQHLLMESQLVPITHGIVSILQYAYATVNIS